MNALAGTGRLIRLNLRRDRIWLPLWIVVVTLVPLGIASSFAALYPNAPALQAFAEENMRTPASVGLLGLVFSPTLGGLVAWRTGLQSAILIAPVSLVLMVRYTRTEEEAGRRELLGATVVGRLAPLTGALVVVLGANLAIAALLAAGLIALGLPAGGSIALGLSAASGGWMFAAVAAVAAQLAESPGAARGLALAAFGLAYVVRIAGDAGGEQGGQYFLTWLSPLGWVRLTRPFAGEQWWVFALSLGLTMALTAAAYALSARRDLGAGALAPRLGPATAAPGLRSPLALAWRLHRGTLYALVALAAAFGIIIGSIGQSMTNFVDTPQLRDWAIGMGAENVGDAFLFVLMYVLGQAASAYAIVATLRMRSEEVEGRGDPLLAAPVSRPRWAGSHLVFAVVGPAIALAALGLTIGLGYGLGAGDVGGELPRLLARTLVTLPAIWVVGGITAALYGLLPRFAVAASWAILSVFLLLELAWELRQVDQAVFDLSPFAHVHWATQPTAAPLLGLTAIAAALTAAGLVGFRRRDFG
jgi:ABC-2 type transport system permease protein